MRSRLTFAFILGLAGGVLSLPAIANAQSDERTLFSLRNESNDTFEFVVSGPRFCATPKWDAEKRQPPLDVRAAIRAAMNASTPRRRWVVESIAMNSGTCIREVRWYYTITLYDEANLETGRLETVTHVVLMDGSVARPRRVTSVGP